MGYNRMNFRWGNVGTFQISPGSHMWQVFTEHYKEERIPITMNFGVPPACTMLAGAGFDYVILPKGCDEVGRGGCDPGHPGAHGEGEDRRCVRPGRRRVGARRLHRAA